MAVTGLILAGGRGTRMGEADKGLVELFGQPMVAHVAARLRPQVDRLLISANRNPQAYAAHGTVVSDDPADGNAAGPLAGVAAALAAARSSWVVTVPCDAPFFPIDLVVRLGAALGLGADPAAWAAARSATWPVARPASGRLSKSAPGPKSGPAAGRAAGPVSAPTTAPTTGPIFAAASNSGLVTPFAVTPGTALGQPPRLAVARAGARRQPVCMLLATDLLDDLRAYLRGGGRRVAAWQNEAGVVEVDFPDESGFLNVNTPADLAAAAARMAAYTSQ